MTESGKPTLCYHPRPRSLAPDWARLRSRVLAAIPSGARQTCPFPSEQQQSARVECEIRAAAAIALTRSTEHHRAPSPAKQIDRHHRLFASVDQILGVTPAASSAMHTERCRRTQSTRQPTGELGTTLASRGSGGWPGYDRSRARRARGRLGRVDQCMKIIMQNWGPIRGLDDGRHV